MFFTVHPELEERVAYIKSAYQDRYTELIVDGVRVGYKPQEDGLLMWEGAYLSRKSESVFSWGIVAELTAGMIDKKEYFVNTQITPPKNVDSQQMSLFDIAGFDAPVNDDEPQMTFFSAPTLPQQVIDTALCLGGNEIDSLERIYAYFSKDYPLEKNAAFLQKEYRRDGKGFFVGDRPYAMWFDENGLRVSHGRSATGRIATVLLWEDVAKRIRELLDMGRYVPQTVIDRYDEVEKKALSESMLYLVGDFTEEAREASYMVTVRGVYDTRGGYPDMTAQLSKMLSDKETVAQILAELDTFATALSENRELLRFRYHRCSEIKEKLEGLLREVVVFPAPEPAEPVPSQFITEDEIDKLLIGGGNVQHSKFRIYAYYREGHTPKERASFLKDEYGWGGTGRMGFNENHDGKGISYSREDRHFKPYDKILLPWNKVEKRISELIRQGRYLTEKELAYIPTYEKEQLAISIYHFFTRVPQEMPHPYPYGFDYYDAIKIIQPQLDDPAKVEAIYQMMLPIWETTTQDDRDYNLCQKGIEYITAYRNGTFSLFGEKKEPRPLVAETAAPVEPTQPTFKDEVIRHLDEAGYAVTEEMLDTSIAEYGSGPAKNTADFIIAKKLIDEYCMEVFEQGADYTDLYHVDLAFSSTADSMHNVEIFADLMRYRLVYQVDGETVHEIACDSMGNLHEYLANLDFDVMVALADEAYQQNNADRDFLDDVDPAAIRQKLAQRGIVDGQVVDEEALNSDPFIRQVMADAEAAQEEPSALIVAQYRSDNEHIVIQQYPNGQYYNRYGYDEQTGDAASTAGGFATLEEAENTLRSHRPAAVKEEPALAPPVKLAPPKPKRERIVFTTLHPEISKEQRHDYIIDDPELGYGTASEKYAANVAAIRCLKRIEEENRLATPEEQEILSRYVGWGGLADCFDDRHAKYQELKSLLTEEEYAAARASSLTAFYTSPIVIRAMYQALSQMGFRQGNILEPSCGVGNFIGMLPDRMAGSQVYGVELDSISGRIAQQLYQNSSIAVTGFEKVQMPDSFFDVAIGNVPFGDFKVLDKKYDKYHWLIHDYFFGKALDKVRPGGIVAFITSKGTMDKENSAVRKYLAQRADLIGAIRLPNDAFKRNAGTEVTSDILFLQKRDRITDIEPDWVHLDTDENGIRMNSYYVQNQEMVLGEMVMESTRFGMDSTCKPYENADLSDMLAEAVQTLHAQITEYEAEELDEEDHSIPADPDVRNFSYTISDGKVYFRENSRMYPVEVSVTAENRIRGMIALRECVRKLIDLQTEGYPDEDILKEQAQLNTLYDEYTTKYGLICSRGNSLAFSDDSSYYLLCSLEVLDEEGNFKRKADMFTKRTIRPHEAVTSVDTASEALAVSIAEKARVDMEYMSALSGKTPEELETELAGVIYRDIRCAEDAADISPAHTDLERYPFVTADEYLSGNVRRKLRMAKALQMALPSEKKDTVSSYVSALEAVQPVDLTAGEIGVRIGVNWIPTEIYEKFMYELFGTGGYAKSKIKILHSKATGEWNITNKSSDSGNVRTFSTYGTKRINAYHILEQTLNQKDVRIFDTVYDEHGNEQRVLNKKETAIAQDRQELIKSKFAEWLWKDIDRRELLCRIYNETFNSIRPREFDGQHIRFYGMNPEIQLRPHQINAIAHIMYGGNTLLAHEVGAGKTFEMVAAAMESKRLGLCTKSLIVVPNHITEQWAAEWLQLYPSANILVATKKDFETRNRKKFCGRIATGDYDAIIIGHSQFEKIPMSRERQEIILQRQIDDIMFGIQEAKRAKAERYTIKQLERTKKSLETRIAKLNDQSRKDDVVTFEQLGVDRIFVDESHYFKNLFLATKMRNVGGIAQTEAQKSSDLFMKCQYLDEITGGRGVVFATGTPISNSMVELYTIQRYLQYSTLADMDMLHFDDWAANYGETITAIELSPEGSGYRSKTRFAKFYNLPELMSTFKMVADIQTADMLHLPVPKANFHTEVIKPSEIQQEMIKGLAERAEAIRAGGVDPHIDNMLRITNDGRKLALDMRLINPLAADDENGKVSVCARNVFDIWERTKEQRSAQMVFCDLSTPKGDGSFNVYDDLKKKLMAKGVPEEEIAFIHDANTEARKKELFAKVRSGQVRVLIGSTQKMGAGTNCQDRLIALHDLDCPWRPSDLAQRLGRIVRQGNQNPEVEIYRYVTENTFDAYLYQLVENKQKFIAQIMTSKAPVRAAEDVDETALSYSEIKALATGNPLIIEKCNLDMEVAKLNMLKANHLNQRYALEELVLRKYPETIQRLTERIAGYEKDIAVAAEHPKPTEGFVGMEILGTFYEDKEAAGKAIIDACTTMTGSDAVFLGQYRGFSTVLAYDGASNEYRMTMKGTLSHTTVLGADIFGNITRMDNVIDGLQGKLDVAREELTETQTQLENARTEMNTPFSKEAELNAKSARLKELNILLNMDQKDRSLLDDVPEEDAPEKTKTRDYER
ncbi:SNF2-related protein [Holdemania sp. Marseille-P2844]|uniref:SNF2-related protein n=1 Tax=Holdemania sp. Marseille-P2844 TaxID=1852366 RepID=UPI001F400AD4|nr:SNF2-related protein [Holdemania sp. Marseille-P2844]